MKSKRNAANSFSFTLMSTVICVLAVCAGDLTGTATQLLLKPNSQKETRMSKRAVGTFEVKLTPQDDKGAEGLGRMTIEKQLYGDFEGTSAGQMLTSMTKVKGSAVYVAVERMSGTLQGRKGSFDLHHVGIMNHGAQQLSINVVPDSGTEQLTGITGTMTIKIVDGKHHYEFDYSVPNTP
jgi:hypothetical protein